MDQSTKYCEMAKLSLTDREQEGFSRISERILPRLDALSEIVADTQEPLYTVVDAKNPLREDIPAKTYTLEEIMHNAPVEHEGYFQVPKAL